MLINFRSKPISQGFESKYKATGKRYDVGKSCVRFKKLEDLPLPLIGESVGSLSVEDFVARVESVRAKPRSRGKRSK